MSPSTPPPAPRARFDALSVFTLLFSHCLSLQVAKDAQTLPSLLAPGAVPTLALALAIARAHVAPSEDASLLYLALAGALVLLLNGSHSNHVLLELAVAFAILASAVASPRRATLSLLDPRPGTRGALRDAFAANLERAVGLVLGVLYLTTGVAKLNDAWHDPSVSCCAHMLVGALSGPAIGLAPRHVARLRAAGVLRVAPAGAAAFELAFPALLRLSRRHVATLRALVLAGAAFHVLIALPPPPMSAYPFSMLMAPMYVVGVARRACDGRVAAINAWRVEAKIAASAALVAAFAYAADANAHSDLFEYPPYFAWEIGATWTALAFAWIVFAVCGDDAGGDAAKEDDAFSEEEARASLVRERAPPRRGPSNRGPSRRRPSVVPSRRSWTSACVLAAPAAFVLTASASQYVGARTYPSFAMFSNLRVEAGASNHWARRLFLPSLDAGGPRRHHHSTYHSALEILRTDLGSLRAANVNLAPLYPAEVTAGLDAAGAEAAFYVSPPAWSREWTEPFRAFAIPTLEARRRVSEAVARNETFFVEYRVVAAYTHDAGGPGPEGAAAASRGATGRKWTGRFEARGGTIAEDREPAGAEGAGGEGGLRLGEALGRIRGWAHRYRSFDLDRSPCRH